MHVPVRAMGLARVPAIFLTVFSGYLLLGGLSPGTIESGGHGSGERPFYPTERLASLLRGSRTSLATFGCFLAWFRQ